MTNLTAAPTTAPRSRPRTDEEIVAAYAVAYSTGDLDALPDLLAPGVVSRLLMPGGLRELVGVDAFVEELAAAAGGVDGFGPHSSAVTPIGDKFLTMTRVVLDVGSDRYHLAHQEVVEVRDGMVVAIDGVCTGFRPVAVRS